MSDKKIMYRVSGMSAIVPYEIVKETEKTVTFINRFGKNETERKGTEHRNWFETKAEAIEYICATATANIERLTRQIEVYQRVIDNLEKKTNHE